MTLCQCEHVVHETPNEAIHPYLGTKAGVHRAIFIGPICDDCASTHMAAALDQSQVADVAYDGRTLGSGKSINPQLRAWFEGECRRPSRRLSRPTDSGRP